MLGVTANFTGPYLDKAIKDDLTENCWKYIGDGMARTLYASIDSQFSQTSPQFNIIVGNSTYLYNIKKIVSTTAITYDPDSESGSAVTTMASDVEVTNGNTKLTESVRFVVLIILLTLV
jgi:hypothetical protein